MRVTSPAHALPLPKHLAVMFLARCAASTAAAPAVVASSSSRSRSVASARDEVSGFRSSRSVHHLRRRRRPSPAATAPRPLRRSGHRDGDCKARIFMRAKAPDDEGDEGAESPDAADAAQTVNAMMREDLGLDVDAIRTLIDEDPEVREQERLMAFEARNAASLQVDAKMAEEESKIAREYGSKETEAGMTLKARGRTGENRKGVGEGPTLHVSFFIPAGLFKRGAFPRSHPPSRPRSRSSLFDTST